MIDTQFKDVVKHKLVDITCEELLNYQEEIIFGRQV
jgi:hypothetical protein